MSLSFEIKVCDNPIGYVELVRTDPALRTAEENEICTYTLKYWDRHSRFSPTPTFRGNIEFPYQKENPIPLLSAALEEIKRNV